MVKDREKDAEIEAANAMALVHDWEETEIKNELKLREAQ